MPTIESYLHPKAFYNINHACIRSERQWARELIAPHSLLRTPTSVLMTRPDGTQESAMAIQKYHIGDPTFLVVQGPCAGFILSPDGIPLRPLRPTPRIDNEADARYTDVFKKELTRLGMSTEGLTWSIAAIIALLQQTIAVPIDASVVMENSLRFSRLEQEWLTNKRRGK